MEKTEKIEIAKIAINKGYNYGTLNYSDYMYGKEDCTDDVWEYVLECKEIGTTAFFQKYP